MRHTLGCAGSDFSQRSPQAVLVPRIYGSPLMRPMPRRKRMTVLEVVESNQRKANLALGISIAVGAFALMGIGRRLSADEASG